MDPTTNFIARATRLAPLLALLLVLAAPPVHANEHDNEKPSASFTNSPSKPVVGEQVTFTSTSTDRDGQITGQWWDLDNDGSYDDGTAKTVTRVFTSAGNKTVRLRVKDNDDATRTVSRSIPVAANRAPTADFSASSTTPDTGQAVTLTSTSTDPDGRPLDAGDTTVVVGPEGGWSRAELDAAWATASLGDTVLRVETAAVVAATLMVGLRRGS